MNSEHDANKALARTAQLRQAYAKRRQDKGRVWPYYPAKPLRRPGFWARLFSLIHRS